MNEARMLEELAMTDAYAPHEPLPASNWTRETALTEIERRIDMQTENRAKPQTPLSRRRNGWLVAAGAAIAVFVLIGGSLWLVGGTGTDVVEEPTVSTTSPVPTTTAPVPVPPTPPMIDSWQRVGEALMEPVVGTFNMTVVGSRLFVVGFDPGEDFRQDGVIFVSDDGVTWARLAESDPALTTGSVLIYGITEGGPGLVGVGMSCEDNAFPCESGLRATAWASVDGASWTRTSHDPAVFGDPATETTGMTDVITTSTGSLVAVGWHDDWTLDDSGGGESVVTSPAAWTSPDGEVWVQTWLGEGFELTADVWNDVPTPPMHAIAEDPSGGLIAVGAMLDQDAESTAAVWTSQDGSDWERVAPASPAFGQKTAMTDIAWGSSGYVAVGTEDDATPAIWISPDGHSWTRVDIGDQPFEITTSVGSVAALESGYVAVGPSQMYGDGDGVVTVWTSADGVTWDRVHSIAQGYASGVVVVDGGIAVSGGMPYDNDYHAAVWVGPRFDPEAPPPDPGPPPEPAPQAAPTGIAVVEEGVSCEEIATEEFTYAEALSYWIRYELTDDFDLDADGTPCAEAYDTADVTAVFGNPEALAVHFVADHRTGTVEATGPAVDAGLVCTTGTLAYTDNPPAELPVLWRWEDEYTCDDGSGTFLLGVDEYIDEYTDDSQAMFGAWNIVTGTGNYADLQGGGATDSVFGEYDASIGRLWTATNDS